MEDCEEKIFDEVRFKLMETHKTISEISKESGVAYITIANILKGKKDKAYRAETYGKLKEYFKDK